MSGAVAALALKGHGSRAPGPPRTRARTRPEVAYLPLKRVAAGTRPRGVCQHCFGGKWRSKTRSVNTPLGAWKRGLLPAWRADRPGDRVGRVLGRVGRFEAESLGLGSAGHRDAPLAPRKSGR